jgi:hypothetical protein
MHHSDARADDTGDEREEVSVMNVEDFTHALERMTAQDLDRVSHEIEARHACVADDLTWWEATVDIDRALKMLHRRRQAAMAAHDAGRAVQHAAAAEGVPVHDAQVTRVARAAAEVARGLVAGPMADVAVQPLLGSFAPLLHGSRT